MTEVKCKTRGNVIVNDLKKGDKIWEFDNMTRRYIEAVVQTKPKVENGLWSFKAKNSLTGNQINYLIDSNPRFINYVPCLYTYLAYKGYQQV